MQSLTRRIIVVLLLLGFTLCCSAARVPLSISQGGATAANSSSAAPGTPWGPCGKAIPAGVSSPKGPGYCQPGYFCGWEENTQQPSKCLPVPGMRSWMCRPQRRPLSSDSAFVSAFLVCLLLGPYSLALSMSQLGGWLGPFENSFGASL